ncbi:MAG TPA: autotransporter-associated beta strand repeat-containing protein [Phycisphaerae bacterium]|nr:autotransporter-associated beta strand repeat-containing protein [Phycisphaerae bacterium]
MAAKLGGAAAVYNPKSRRIIMAAALAGLVGVMARSATCGAASLASDNASNSPYSGGQWSTGQNGGSGFSSWWVGTPTFGSNSTGSGVDQSSTWGFNDSSAYDLFGTTASPNINTDQNPFNPSEGNSWDMWSSDVEPVDPVGQVGYRPFSSNLAVGESFSINIATGNMGTQGSEGFQLQNLTGNPYPNGGYSTPLFEFAAFGSGTYYAFDSGGYATKSSGFSNHVLTGIKSVHDGSSTENNGNGLTVTFTLTSSTSFTLTVTPLSSNQGTAESFYNEILTNQNSEDESLPLNQLMLYNDNLGTEGTQSFYSNSMQISSMVLYWTGTSSSSPSGNGENWDVQSNYNWYNASGLALSEYYQNVAVNFDDTWNSKSVSNYNVTLNTAVTPASVMVNNSTGNYVISGTGSIGGSTSLVKEGTGSLTLSIANSYTGGTQIGQGTLIIGNGSAIPTGSSLTFGDGTNSGTLDLDGIGATVGSLAIISGSNGTITNNGSSVAALTFAGGTTSSTFSGTIKNGAGLTELAVKSGTLTISGPNTYSGGTVVNGGTLIAAATNTLGTGALTVNAGTLELDGHNETFANLQGTGGAINNVGSTNAVTLTFGGDNTSQTFGGSISNGASAGALSLVDNSTGTQTFKGTLSYTGTTTITSGTLKISGANTETLNGKISGNGNLVVGDGSTVTNLTLGGTIINEGSTIINNASTLVASSSARMLTPLITVQSGGIFNVSAVSGGFSLGGSGSQELNGNGTVVGNVTVTASGNLSPGDAIGPLTVNGNVTLDGTFSAQVDPANAESPPNDELVTGSSGTVALGGALAVSTSNSTPLASGDSYTLINAAGGIMSGSFNTVNLPTLNSGLSWDITMMNDNPDNYQNKYTASVVNTVPAGFTLGSTIYTAALAQNQSYNGFYIQRPANDSSNSRQTTVQFLGGTASTATSLAVQFADAPSNNTQLLSDVATINGTNSDTYVLQMSYSVASSDGVLSPVLAAYNPSTSVADGQSLETGTFVSAALLTGATPVEFNGAYAGQDVVGDYGINTANDTVWAVLNYSDDDFVVLERSDGDWLGAGSVNAADLDDVVRGLGASTLDPNGNPVWSEYAFDGGTTVDAADLDDVVRALGSQEVGGSAQSSGGLTFSSSSPSDVPEPGGLLLLGMGSMILSLTRRRSKLNKGALK